MKFTYNIGANWKMQHQTTTENKADKPELNYLEDFLRRAGKPAYILAVLRANVLDSTIRQLEERYQQEDAVFGVTGLLDTVVIVVKDQEKVQSIAKDLSSATGKYVGILKYVAEPGIIRLYSEVYNAAKLAEKEDKCDRLYNPEKDSLECRLGIKAIQ